MLHCASFASPDNRQKCVHAFMQVYISACMSFLCFMRTATFVSCFNLWRNLCTWVLFIFLPHTFCPPAMLLWQWVFVALFVCVCVFSCTSACVAIGINRSLKCQSLRCCCHNNTSLSVVSLVCYRHKCSLILPKCVYGNKGCAFAWICTLNKHH